MKEKNLPIKLVMQRSSDSKKNLGGGEVKFFGDVTDELRGLIINKFEAVAEYYKDVFNENENMPAVGKMIVKPEAIAKSHTPNELCQNCPIIGGEDLDELYIRVTAQGIKETIKLVDELPSKKFKANLTTILDIKPVTVQDKISVSLSSLEGSEGFQKVKDQIKVKLFDFGNEYDDLLIKTYFHTKLADLGLQDKIKVMNYGEKIQLIKVEVESFDHIRKIASINGVKSVDFFPGYSLPANLSRQIDVESLLKHDLINSEVVIGIIDGGIGKNVESLKPYIFAREEYVPEVYQNHEHATFIASTILFGNTLNGIEEKRARTFKFVDIVAIPNGDPKHGATDSISETELMEIIEKTMEKYAQAVKIWNLSLGIDKLVCDGSISDLAVFLDYIQDKYGVQFFVSSGNLIHPPLRTWPPQETMGERDRIISPADSVRAITVGSIAFLDSPQSLVRKNEPSPFSRRGPGANYSVKPDVVDFGGNMDSQYRINGLGMKGLGATGEMIEGNGTSYSNPRVVQKYACIYDGLMEKDLLLAKALTIHSARMTSRELLDNNRENIKYYGFGMPAVDVDDVLLCSKEEVTLIFRQKVVQSFHLEMLDFPYPPSLIRSGKYFGEIAMTLAYNPLLDHNFGSEYCRINIDASFGTYVNMSDGTMDYKGQVPLEVSWDEKFERARVENGFKWSPLKSYYRKIKRGIDIASGWKIRVDMTPRNNVNILSQDFVLILTIKDPDGNDIYTEMVNGLREKGYITSNLETRHQVRQRQ